MSAAEVVEKHVVSEGAGAGLLMGLEAVPWIIGQLRGLIITAIVLLCWVPTIKTQTSVDARWSTSLRGS